MSPERQSPRMVGRSDELHRLHRAIGSVSSGRGAATYLLGEAGVGRRRLAEEGLRSARNHGFEVRSARAEVGTRAEPFAPLLDLLGVADGAPELGPAVDAVTGAIEVLVARAPLALVVGDLDRAGPEAVAVLTRIADRLPGWPLAIVATLSSTSRARPDLARLLAGLRGDPALVIEVAPLDEVEVLQLAVELAGGPPGRRLRDQLSATAGNPAMIIDLLDALREEGQLERDAGGCVELRHPRLPASFCRLIEQRVDLLGLATARTLRLAAHLGGSFSAGDVASVLADPEADPVSAVREAVGAGLLVDRAGGQLTFRQDLVRTALYEAQPPETRRAVHLRIGRALAHRGAPALRVATHLALGAEPGDDETVAWLRSAAAEASHRAPLVAQELLQQAVSLVRPDHPERDRLLAERAASLLWAGRARDAGGEAGALLERSLDPVLRDEVHVTLARALHLQGRCRDAAVHLEMVATAGEAGARHDHALLLGEAALLRAIGDDRARALDLAEQAVVRGVESSDLGAVGLALLTQSLVAVRRGFVDEALELSGRALSVGRHGAAGVASLYHPHLWHGLQLIEADRLDEAAAVLGAGRRLVDGVGGLWPLALYEAGLGAAHAAAGRWEAASEALASAIATGSELGLSWTVAAAHTELARLAHLRADPGDAAQHLLAAERGARDGQREQDGREWRALVASELAEDREDGEEALGVVVRAWEAALTGDLPLHQLRLGPRLVRLASAHGDVARCRAAIGTVEAAATRTRTRSAEAALLRCRGLAGGRPELLIEAVELYRLIPRPLELAGCCEDAGAELERGGRTPDAIRLLREALALHRSLGGIHGEARVAARLRGLGAHTAVQRGPARAREGWSSLTRAENRVVELVAQGLSTPEIAGRLFVSPRTVETHLAHVYGKLGVGSRGALAAAAANRDAAADSPESRGL